MSYVIAMFLLVSCMKSDQWSLNGTFGSMEVTLSYIDTNPCFSHINAN